jgi:hypothetical protein
MEQAIQALEKLEAAINASDNYQIGAALYWLRRELDELKKIIRWIPDKR